MGENGDQMLVVAKILNMKDKLMQQILNALLYKKTVIWTDLRISPGTSDSNSDEIYVDKKIFDIKERIVAYESELKYLPARIPYEAIDPEEAGVYTDSRPE